ncbi:MAG: LytTR family DNA-binding domain-containing protein [Saprospiraceae bacterium]|nr:LytTR family DNA-binding domain-containing protein [Saprospiraceae bacterium]
MKVLIVEDEKLASEYLEGLLEKSSFEIEVIDRVDSVKNGIKWFLKNDQPDLVFMDVDLGDGLCFEIFDAVDVSCPIVFTTAYDTYAIQAFKVNSIDYLLKPVDKESLIQALQKLSRWGSKPINQMKFRDMSKMLTEGYKERFIVKIGSHLKTIPVKEVLFCYSQRKATYATTRSGRNYLVDYSLDRLEDVLNPADYFRINRKYILAYGAIQDIVAYSNSRLKVKVMGSDDDKIIVARDRVNSFKEWLDR